MRKIVVSTFLTMDGVLQAPGGPEEDRTGGFEWGGWIFPYGDDQTDKALEELMARPFDLLLGRRTYEIFAAHWPYQHDKIGELFNRINKYVVATTDIDISWKNSILIDKNVVDELKKLKAQEGSDLLVHGSGKLVQTLLSNGLVDELYTWTYPITLGKGKRLFEEGTQAGQWKLLKSSVSTTGVIIASYVPDGEVKKGSFMPVEANDAELARREKWAKGG